MKISITTVAEFFAHPEAAGLLAEYAEECANKGLPAPNPDRELYAVLERAEMLTLFVATVETHLAGVAVLLVAPNAHYSVRIASTESLFVAPAYRKMGAGLALLREIEREARERDAAGLYISAPLDGPLDRLLAKCTAYRPTNRTHFRGFR